MTEQTRRKILAIDDNQTNLALLQVHLRQMGLEPLLYDKPQEGIDVAQEEVPDLILLDIMMPDMDGLEVCQKLKNDSRTSQIPIIFISAKDQSRDKIAGLQMGAIDFITKPFDPEELKTRIGIILKMIELQEKLVALANTDALTGLANRRSFLEILERQVLQCKHKDTPLAIIMLDLDHFKHINDTYGHLGGDVILKQLAKIIQDNIYPLDIAARYGGEEFIVIMPDTPLDKAMQAAERLRSLILNCKWKIAIDQPFISASFGVAVTDGDSLLTAYELTKQADIALYSAKRRGRNCVVCWDQVHPEEEQKEQENQDVRKLQAQIYTLANQLRSQALGSVTALCEALAAKDPFIADHAEHVRIYAHAIAGELDLSQDLIEQINNAALLHDIGKISLPAHILNNTSELTDDEMALVRLHPTKSVQIISPIGIFNQELQIIKHHHENFDGSGYPDGLQGRQIPFGARILAVANAFDAISSDRRHRQGRSREETLEELVYCSGTQFDPDIVKVFLNVAEFYQTEWPLKSKDQSPCVQANDDR